MSSTHDRCAFNVRAHQRQVKGRRQELGQEQAQGPANGSSPFLTPPSPNQPPTSTTRQPEFQTPELTTSSSTSYKSGQPSSLLPLSTLLRVDGPNSPITSPSYQEIATLSRLSVSTTLSLTVSTTTIVAPKEMATAFDSNIIPTIIGGVLGGVVLITLLFACAILWLRGRRKKNRGGQSHALQYDRTQHVLREHSADRPAETRELYIQQPIMWTLRIPPISSQDRNREVYRQSQIPLCSPPSTPLSALALMTDSTSLVVNTVPPAQGGNNEYLDVAPVASPTNSIVWSEFSATLPIYAPGAPPPYISMSAHIPDRKT